MIWKITKVKSNMDGKRGTYITLKDAKSGEWLSIYVNKKANVEQPNDNVLNIEVVE